MSAELSSVPKMSSNTEKPVPFELIDSVELAKRWNVPVSWIRTHVRGSVRKEDRIPCIRLGRYVRFEADSPQLTAWLARHRD